MGKRRNGEGTWGKKTIKGSEYKYFRNSDGKYFYGKTEKEIKQKIKDYIDSQDKNLISNDQILYDYVLCHLKTRRLQLSDTTYDAYEDAVDNMLKNYTIGNMSISSITERNLRDYVEELSKKYSRASIEKMYKILNPALQYAVEHHHIEKNYLDNIKIPSEDNVAVKKKTVPFIIEDDLKKLYTESNRINAKGYCYGGKIGEPTYGSNAKAVMLIAYTGLRVSELKGLKWENVDIKNKVMHIQNAVVRVKNHNDNIQTKYSYKMKGTKSKSSERDIPLSNTALEMIDYFDKLHPNHKDTDLVVLNKNVKSPIPRNIQTTLDAMLVRSGCSISHCGLHGLRHSFGAILLCHKVDIKIVSKLLGHKDITTTYNIYIDFTKEQVSNEALAVLN